MDLEINSLKCWARKRSRPPAEPALKLQIARATTAHETDNISEESLDCSGQEVGEGWMFRLKARQRLIIKRSTCIIGAGKVHCTCNITICEFGLHLAT